MSYYYFYYYAIEYSTFVDEFNILINYCCIEPPATESAATL